MGGGMMGGMGGMGGGMMGGMGGMMSVPPTGLPEATVKPGQTRTLPTNLVKLTGPNTALPVKGEPLRIGDISQLTKDPKIQAALRKLSAQSAPEPVIQLVIWNLEGINWETLTRISKGWANAHELALARDFVARIDQINGDDYRDEKGCLKESGVLFFEVKTADAADADLVREMTKLLEGYGMLGLKAKAGLPDRPEGPALGCRIELVGTGEAKSAVVTVVSSDPKSADWVDAGNFKFELKRDDKGELKPALVAGSLAEGVLGQVVLVRLVEEDHSKGRGKAKVKPTFQIQIKNVSPLILNGLALAGPEPKADRPPTALAGMSLPPAKVLSVPASAEMVEALGLAHGVRPVAANLSGL